MIATDKYSGLSAAQARELLTYDPETGILTWKVSRGKAVAGREAGMLNRITGYISTGISKRYYRNSRLAWLIHHGRWPDNYLDHIDGDRTNNKIANLRDVSASVNLQNLRNAMSSNKLGVLGVIAVKRKGYVKYRAKVHLGGRDLYVKLFDTIEEASNAYLKAKRELHEGNTL